MNISLSSSSGLPSDIEYFLECGAGKVLLKPLDMDRFSKAMKEVSERSRRDDC